MAEKIDVLDEYGIRTGEILSRKEIHAQGKIHRAVHLYLFDKSNNLLLQRRSMDVDHYPGMFSISMTGHIDAGESSGQTVRRELKEELGLESTNAEIDFLFSFRQDAEISPTYIDRQFNDVYACWADFTIKDIKIQFKEVSEVKLVPFEEFNKMVAGGSETLAPVYEREAKDVVYFLRNRIVSLE